MRKAPCLRFPQSYSSFVRVLFKGGSYFEITSSFTLEARFMRENHESRTTSPSCDFFLVLPSNPTQGLEDRPPVLSSPIQLSRQICSPCVGSVCDEQPRPEALLIIQQKTTSLHIGDAQKQQRAGVEQSARGPFPPPWRVG